MQETKMGTRKQVADPETVPRSLTSLSSLDRSGVCDVLQQVVGLGWDRGWEDKNLDRVPHGDSPSVGRLIQACDPPAIQNPAPPQSRYRQTHCALGSDGVTWGLREYRAGSWSRLGGWRWGHRQPAQEAASPLLHPQHKHPLFCPSNTPT